MAQTREELAASFIQEDTTSEDTQVFNPQPRRTTPYSPRCSFAEFEGVPYQGIPNNPDNEFLLTLPSPL